MDVTNDYCQNKLYVTPLLDVAQFPDEVPEDGVNTTHQVGLC